MPDLKDLERDVGLLRDLVNDLADTGKCWYDHHGHCQEHGWFTSDVECPHARAQRLWDADGKEKPVSEPRTPLTTTARTAAEDLNKEGWLLADATAEELDKVAAIIAARYPHRD